MMRLGRFRFPYSAALAGVLLLAALLRFAGLNWDDGYYLHPDERFMVMVTADTDWPDSVGQYFDSASSPLNPYNTRHGTFVYGTFPMFLTKAVSTLLGKDVYGETHLAGRAISALADTGTVFLVAWIARRFFGRAAGLLAGLLFASTVLHVQTAHYYTVDSISVFFATAAFVTTVKGWDRRSLGWFATAGLMIGLAGASKPNYLIALAFLGLPIAEMVRLHGFDSLFRWTPGPGRRFPILPAVALAGLVAFWTFRIAQPYAFAGPSFWDIRLNPQWLDDLSYWRSAQSGLIDIKSSIQWVDRTPVIYILDNLVRWGMGPPLGIAALVGLAALAFRLIGAKTWPSWWMLGIGGWCVSQLLLYGLNMAQAQRYLMPIYPFLVALGGGFLAELARRLRPIRPLRLVGPLLICITVAYTLFYAVAFDSLFVRPLSRVQASEWIYENVPAGSSITSEYWDDALPMRLEGQDAGQYRSITLDLYAYEGPGSLKLSKLIGQLNQADYIVLSSNRIIGSVPRQPERYPMASRYYEMLLNGDLGFDLVAEFQQKPELFGIALNDVDAEETLTVYEHPYVRILRKSPRFNAHRVYNDLEAALGYGGINYLPGDPLGHQMLLSPTEQAAFDEHGTWRTKFNPDSLSNRLPVIWWYVALQLMIVPALPICWLLFRRLPDHGYALAKVCGLLVVTWAAWLLAALHIVPFGSLSIALAWVTLLLLGTFLARHQLTRMTEDWYKRWRWLLTTEALFAILFVTAAWVRSLNPAFWQPTGNDQSPFWFAIFNAAARSTTFPTYDPWLSGGKLHLATWGQLPWVVLTRLTGVVPATAWNLAFAGIVAVTGVTLWSAGAALAIRFSSTSGKAGRIALFTTLIAMSGAMVTLHESSRQEAVIAQVVNAANSSGNPLIALIAGNLDPVTTTMPIIAFAIAVAVAITAKPERSLSPQWPLESGDLARVTLAGFLAGAMAASSTWGMLPAVGLIIVAVVVRLVDTGGLSRPWPLLRNTVALAVFAGGVSYAAFWPAIQAVTTTQRDIRTGPIPDLRVMAATFAIPLVVLVPWVSLQALHVLRDAHDEHEAGRWISLVAALLALTALLVATTIDNTFIALLLVTFLAMLAAWRLHMHARALLTLGLVALGVVAILLSGMTPMTADPFGSNSAHSLGSFSWLLFAVATAAVMTGLVERLAETENAWRRAGTATWLVVFAVILGMGITTPVLAIRHLTTTTDAPQTLDATAFMAQDTVAAPLDLAADREAEEWMMSRLGGLPVIVEAMTTDSQLGGRMSAMTGLPTIIGWNTPERMMRPGWGELVTQRQEAVRAIFGSSGDFSSIEPLLKQYEVDLIYVGTVERAIYPEPALRKFDSAVESGDLVVIYRSATVTIYAYAP